jgi:hypothetical protein
VDEKVLSTVVLDVRFQYAIYVQYLVLPKHQDTAKNGISLEKLMIVRAVAVNKLAFLDI